MTTASHNVVALSPEAFAPPAVEEKPVPLCLRVQSKQSSTRRKRPQTVR